MYEQISLFEGTQSYPNVGDTIYNVSAFQVDKGTISEIRYKDGQTYLCWSDRDKINHYRNIRALGNGIFTDKKEAKKYLKEKY